MAVPPPLPAAPARHGIPLPARHGDGLGACAGGDAAMQVNAPMKADAVSFHGRGLSESGFETSDGDIHAQQRPGGAQPRPTDDFHGQRIRHLTRRRSTASAIAPAAATTLPPGSPAPIQFQLPARARLRRRERSGAQAVHGRSGGAAVRLGSPAVSDSVPQPTNAPASHCAKRGAGTAAATPNAIQPAAVPPQLPPCPTPGPLRWSGPFPGE